MKVLSSTAKGVKAKKKLKHWIPMCNTWAFNIERYTRLTSSGDAPYDNNERANVGLLAGAAWSCGNIALEEFQTTKGSGNNEKNGRIDLWLCSEEFKEEYVEAKFLRMPIKGDYIKKIKSTLSDAVKDAEFSRGDDETSAVGVAFIVLYMKEREIEEILIILDETIKNVQSSINHDLLSWCYPERDMSYVYNDGIIVPGILMLAKKA